MKAFVIDDGTEADVLQAILSRKLSVQQMRYDLEKELSGLNRPAIVQALNERLQAIEDFLFNRPTSEVLKRYEPW